MTYRVRNIGIAVALAVLAAVMISYYVTNYKHHVQRQSSDVAVLVAAKDIPVGTPGAVAAGQHLLRSETVTRAAVVPGAISNPSELAGLVSTQIIYAGEQVSTRRFATQAAQGVRSSLTGVQRVIQLPGDANQLLAGTLKTGDHVDVIGSWGFPTQSAALHVGKVIIHDLKVLRAPSAPLGNEASRITASPDSAFSVQLQLTDAQAQMLFWLVQNGTWTLSLRPTVGAANNARGADTPGTLLGGGPDTGQGKNLIHQAYTGGQQ